MMKLPSRRGTTKPVGSRRRGLVPVTLRTGDALTQLGKQSRERRGPQPVPLPVYPERRGDRPSDAVYPLAPFLIARAVSTNARVFESAG